MILRIEDLDASRVRDEAKAGALEDLAWLGLDWDEGPYVQSERIAAYEASLERLRASESVYPCTCTRADILHAASAPHAEDEGPTYPGTCAGRAAADADSLPGPFSWRFRVPPGRVGWPDLFRGDLEREPASMGGDFIVARSAGSTTYSYQLAVVHDDATMGVNQVIRGDDLVPSTPRQVLLHRALGWREPQFGHVPLVLGPDGRRLAKRDGSIKLATWRAAGVDPRRLVGVLAQSCGWAGRVIPSFPRDWIDRFDPAAIPAEPWTLTMIE